MAILFSVWGCAVFLSVGPEGEEFEEHAEECEYTVPHNIISIFQCIV